MQPPSPSRNGCALVAATLPAQRRRRRIGQHVKFEPRMIRNDQHGEHALKPPGTTWCSLTERYSLFVRGRVHSVVPMLVQEAWRFSKLAHGIYRILRTPFFRHMDFRGSQKSLPRASWFVDSWVLSLLTPRTTPNGPRPLKPQQPTKECARRKPGSRDP